MDRLIPVPEAVTGGPLRRAAAPLILAAGFATVAAAVALRVIAPAGPLDWDEGLHALFGFRAFEALRRFEFLTFLYDSYRSVYWPPLHAWLLAAVVSVAGASAASARAASLAALAAAVLFTFLAGRRIGGQAAGTMAALVLLAAPGVAVLSGRAMLEVPALALLTAGLFFSAAFLDPSRVPTRTAAMLPGFLVFATFLTKANYGILLALALSATFVATRGAAPGARQRSWLLAALGLALPLALWFAYTPKIPSTLDALANFPVGPARFSREGLLFYLCVAPALVGAPFLVLLAAGTAVALARRRREPAVLCVALLGAFQLLFAELSATKLDRHLLPLVPVLALLGSVGLADAFRLTSKRGRAVLVLMGAVALAIQIPDYLHALRPATPATGDAFLGALVTSLPERPSFAVVGTTDGPVAPATIDFFLAGRGLLPVDGAASLHLPSEERALAVLDSRLPRIFGRFLERRRHWPGPSAFTAYLGLPRGDADRQWTEANVASRLAVVLADRPADVVVVVSSGGKLWPDVTAEFWESRLSPLGYRPKGKGKEASGAILTAFCRGDPSGLAPSAPPAP